MSTTLPTWLDAAAEIKDSKQPEYFSKLPKKEKDLGFVLLCFRTLLEIEKELSLGLNKKQILEIVGNAVGETGWGAKWNCWNLGGWKMNSEYAKSYFKTNGVPASWYKSEGHVLGGDDPVVYYRGFDSINSFFKSWLNRFVPKTTPKKTDTYYKTSISFWSNGNWFYELCVSGYKGDVTKKNPMPSVNNHLSVTSRIKTLIAQFVLGLSYDGIWGTKSKLECSKFQVANACPQTGLLDDKTFNLILDKWIKDGMKLNFKE